MAFKLNNPPNKIDNTPIYHVDMEDGVMGKPITMVQLL